MATPTEVGAAPGLRRVLGTKLLLVLIVGDILGTGIYALVGEVAGEVGGVVWVPFLLAFVVAAPTALSYLELVTKYPQAAGSALYAHKAFGRERVTFLVGFAVLCSVIGSAATGAYVFAAHLSVVLDVPPARTTLTSLSVLVVAAVMVLNLRGLREGMVANVVFTAVELTGLVIVVAIGLVAAGHGDADFSRALQFSVPGERSLVLALLSTTSLAFFAMVGFEDSVNMAEETVDTARTFPRAILGGLAFTATMYLLVCVTAVAVVPPSELADSETPLTVVVQSGLPGVPVGKIFAVITMFALAHTTLLNLLTASRLLYGMAVQGVVPSRLGAVLPKRRTPWAAIVGSSVLAAVLVAVVAQLGSNVIGLLAGTTALFHLAVFAVVNIAVLVLRRQPAPRPHFRTRWPLALAAAVVCLLLTTPVTGRGLEQYVLAGALLLMGVALSAATTRSHRRRAHPA